MKRVLIALAGLFLFAAGVVEGRGQIRPITTTPTTTTTATTLPDRINVDLHYDDGVVQFWTCEPYYNAYEEPALRDCQESP